MLSTSRQIATTWGRRATGKPPDPFDRYASYGEDTQDHDDAYDDPDPYGDRPPAGRPLLVTGAVLLSWTGRTSRSRP